MAEYQVQLQHENADGAKTNMYPINTSLDVMVGEVETPTILQLPGVKKGETLKTSLENIKLYLKNLSNIATYQRKVSSSLVNESDIDLATSKAVFDLKNMIVDDRLAIAKKSPTVHSSDTADQYGAGTDDKYGHVKLSDVYDTQVTSGSAKMSMGASQLAVYNAYKTLNDVITKLTETVSKHTTTNASDTALGHVKVGGNITHKDGVISITSENLIGALGYDPEKKFGSPYTNGEGISIVDSKIINDGVRSIDPSTTVNGALDVNIGGAISCIKIPGLKSAAFTESSAYATSNHSHPSLSGFVDERDVNTTPSSYNGTFKVQGLKANTSVDKPDSSTYSTLLGVRGDTNNSAGDAHEFALTGSGGLFRRSGADSWGPWKEILDSGNYSKYIPSLEGTNASGTWGIDITGKAAKAALLETARKINGVAFDGSADITTTLWGTARKITIGAAEKSIDGSKDIEYTLTEIGAAPATHDHNYAGSSTAGGAANSSLKLGKTSTFTSSGEGGLYYYDANMTNVANTNAWSAPATGWHQILHMSLSVANYWNELAFPINDTKGLGWRQRKGDVYSGWFRLLDSNNYKDYVTLENIGAAAENHAHPEFYSSSVEREANTVLAAPNGAKGSATFRKLVADDLPTHTHPYLPLSGGTLNNGAFIVSGRANDTRKLKIGDSYMSFIAPTGGWSNGFYYRNMADDTQIGIIGAYGESDTLKYYHFGNWDAPVAKLTVDGEFITNKFTGDGSNLTKLNPANLSTVVPVTLGGTGKTTLQDGMNALVNALPIGDTSPADNDFFIAQYVNGGTSNTNYYRKPMSFIWDYISSKLGDEYLKKSGGTMTGSIVLPTGASASTADGIVYGNNLARIGCNASGALGLYSSSTMYFRPGEGSISASYGMLLNTTGLVPASNNTMDLGASGTTWKDVYATNFKGNASSATKLETARTISLDTAVSATAKEFDGSANISIPVTSVKEAYLTWGGRNYSGDFGPIDAALVPELGANRLAFMPAAGITVEYSQDGGSTWVAYSTSDESKINLFNGVGAGYLIGGSSATNIDKSKYMLRVTIDSSAGKVYTELRKFVIYCSTNGSTGSYCTIQARTQTNYAAGTDTWVTLVSKQGISGWSGYNVINTQLTTYGNANSPGHYRQVRFIFGVTSHASTITTPGLNISRIMGFGGVGWTSPSNMARYGRMYTYDASQNVTFPAGVTATKFIGDGSGLTSLNPANLSTVVPATKGGTGKSTLVDSANALINALTTGTSDPVDDDYFISQSAGGGTTTTTYHRRPVSLLWNYMKSKIDSVLGLNATSYSGSAAKWTTKRVINGMSIDGSANAINYGVCATAAATAAKTVAITGFSLITGSTVKVKFSYTNTVANPTLNVNSTGAKAIYYRGSAISTSYLKAGSVYEFVYDGTNWEFIGDINTNTTYSAATTSANGLMSSTDKAKMNYTNVGYGTCATAAATAAKVVTISGNTNWALTAGSIITVKFTYTNTASNPTLNVNSTGAKSIWYNTALITTSNLGYGGTANRPMIFMYDGTQYVFIGWSVDSNTTYSNASLGQGYGTCATAAATAAKVVTLSSYTLVTGGLVAVKFTYAVPASATMNINSKGAKAIYHKGAAIKAGVITAGATALFIYNGSYYHLITTDALFDNKVNSDGVVTGIYDDGGEYYLETTDGDVQLATYADFEEVKKSVADGKALLATSISTYVTTASDATFDTINTNMKSAFTKRYNAGLAAASSNADIVNAYDLWIHGTIASVTSKVLYPFYGVTQDELLEHFIIILRYNGTYGVIDSAWSNSYYEFDNYVRFHTGTAEYLEDIAIEIYNNIQNKEYEMFMHVITWETSDGSGDRSSMSCSFSI